MEKVVTITKVQPLKERSYINGNGENEQSATACSSR